MNSRLRIDVPALIYAERSAIEVIREREEVRMDDQEAAEATEALIPERRISGQNVQKLPL
jgi:hypothetical protein